jgi:hypothetical protein
LAAPVTEETAEKKLLPEALGTVDVGVAAATALSKEDEVKAVFLIGVVSGLFIVATLHFFVNQEPF